MLGNGRIEAKCQDGETRLAQIRGQMRKKVSLVQCRVRSPSRAILVLIEPHLTFQVWIVQGDIILISLREFQDDRADVIHKYTADEARNLKTYGELKSDFQINEAAQGGDEGSEDEEGGVEFEEADIDDICECTVVDTADQRVVVQLTTKNAPGCPFPLRRHWSLFLALLSCIIQSCATCIFVYRALL
jgi:translation initiation factor 1A